MLQMNAIYEAAKLQAHEAIQRMIKKIIKINYVQLGILILN